MEYTKDDLPMLENRFKAWIKQQKARKVQELRSGKQVGRTAPEKLADYNITTFRSLGKHYVEVMNRKSSLPKQMRTIVIAAFQAMKS